MGRDFTVAVPRWTMLAYFLRSRRRATPISLGNEWLDQEAYWIVAVGSVLSVRTNGALEELVEATSQGDCAVRARHQAIAVNMPANCAGHRSE